MTMIPLTWTKTPFNELLLSKFTSEMVILNTKWKDCKPCKNLCIKNFTKNLYLCAPPPAPSPRALWTPVFHVPCALCSLVSCALWGLFPYVPYCFLPCVLYVLYHHFCTWGSISRKHLTLLFFCSFAICDFFWGKFAKVKTNIVCQ